MPTPLKPTQIKTFRLNIHLAFAVLLSAAVAPQAHAQFKGFGGFGGLGGDSDAAQMTATAQFVEATAERPAALMISGKIQDNWHVYALSQPKGGPQKMQINLTPSASFRLLGPFRATPEYDSHVDNEVWVGLELREHHGEITLYAPIELAEGTNADQLTIAGSIQGQACSESTCVPIKVPFEAKLGSGVPIGELSLNKPAQKLAIGQTIPSVLQTFQPTESSIVLSGLVKKSGNALLLEITATPPAGYHVYARANQESKVGPKPALVVVSVQSSSGLTASEPQTNAPTIAQDMTDIGWGVAQIHAGPVTWTTQIPVPPTTPAGPLTLSGIVGFQACEGIEGSCESPKAARFSVIVDLRDVAIQDEVWVATFTTAKYSEASALAAQASGAGPPNPQGNRAAAITPGTMAGTAAYDLSQVQTEETGGSLLSFLLAAFLGGIILNLMPCVLPVIGLKLMSFVDQAGQSRSQALKLNIWYSAGIISVFLFLAGLAITAGLAWGGQFGSTTFNVSLAALVFAMALSLLGVWEIPIPGFFGSGHVHDATAKEGPLGAFLKGVFTTILATPCTGPFMASAIAWAVRQSPFTTLLVFGSVGLGMASPYLLIGAFPGLIRFLPKPGMWMETFKHIMGFVMLGTVVFLLSFMDPAAVVPTVALLVGIGIACWSVSRTPITAEFKEQVETWSLAGALVLLATVVSFGWLYPSVTAPRLADRVAALAAKQNGGQLLAEAEWQPFSLARLHEAAVVQGRTVMVDFSADWCFNCKALEKAVLHTADVEHAIDSSGVITMYGDFTDYPEEIANTIKALGGNGVPLIAVFPGNDPHKPITFTDGYTKKGLINAIDKATQGDSTASSRPAAQVSAAPAPGLN